MEVDQQVGLWNEVGHQVEDLHVGAEVARRHEPHAVEVVGEDVRILVHGAVLEDDLRILRQHVHRLPYPAAEERNLQIERPAIHILVEIADVGVVRILQVGLRAVASGEDLRERRPAAADISCYCYIHDRMGLFIIVSVVPRRRGIVARLLRCGQGRTSPTALRISARGMLRSPPARHRPRRPPPRSARPRPGRSQGGAPCFFPRRRSQARKVPDGTTVRRRASSVVERLAS